MKKHVAAKVQSELKKVLRFIERQPGKVDDATVSAVVNFDIGFGDFVNRRTKQLVIEQKDRSKAAEEGVIVDRQEVLKGIRYSLPEMYHWLKTYSEPRVGYHRIKLYGFHIRKHSGDERMEVERMICESISDYPWITVEKWIWCKYKCIWSLVLRDASGGRR